VATELIIQQNVNTINSFECMNFHARNKKMHTETKIQQCTALSFCVNLSPGIEVSNGCDITQISSAMRGFSLVEIYCHVGILGFHGNIRLLQNAGNSLFDFTLHNYNVQRFGEKELVDLHSSGATRVKFFVFNT